VISSVGGFFRRNVEEIAADPVLRVYGAVLAFVHALTFLFWRRGTPLQAARRRNQSRAGSFGRTAIGANVWHSGPDPAIIGP
jgi:hypothetical protein